MTDRTERTAFLYPFLESSERHPDVLLADLAASAVAKRRDSLRLRRAMVEHWLPVITALGAQMAQRFGAGGRLFTFGNGGSATDADGIADMYRGHPGQVAVHARSLLASPAVVTALGNDVGFDLVFSRQLIAHAGPGDVALGVSTSGGSSNVLAAFAEARRRGMLTVGLAGYGGGQMAASPDVDHCLVVASDSVHRIQEAQAALVFSLWRSVQEHMRRAPREGPAS